MNFSFWPFLWFGLPGRLLTISSEQANQRLASRGRRLEISSESVFLYFQASGPYAYPKHQIRLFFGDLLF